MTDTTEKTQPRLELSGIQVVGGALAATTSAVAASYLGVAGTLAGAALGSVVATVGGSLYTYSLRRTTDRVRTVAHRTPAGTTVTATATTGTVEGAADGPAPARRRAVQRRGPIVAAAAAFAVAVGGITAVELVAGEPISTVVYSEPATNGTTLGSVAEREPQEPESGDVAPEPTPSVSPGDGDQGPGDQSPSDQPPGDEAPAPDSSASPSPGTEGSSGNDPEASPAPGSPAEAESDPPAEADGDPTAAQDGTAVDGPTAADSATGSQPVAAPPPAP